MTEGGFGISIEDPVIGRWICENHGVVVENRRFSNDYSAITSVTMGGKDYCAKCIADFMAEHFCELKYIEVPDA